jgi:hypothetical protein
VVSPISALKAGCPIPNEIPTKNRKKEIVIKPVETILSNDVTHIPK